MKKWQQAELPKAAIPDVGGQCLEAESSGTEGAEDSKIAGGVNQQATSTTTTSIAMAGTKVTTATTTSGCRLGKGQQQQKNQQEGDFGTSQHTTMRPGKRRHQASVSPVTARSESKSPRAKQRPAPNRQSPPTVTAAPISIAASTTITASRARSDSCSGSVSPSQLAVPRVSAEPPCPSKLPMPPMHWVAAEEKDTAQRQHCRAVTESLLCHLTTKGILVTA
ncbi:uncharacterized protein LOC123515722 [Portunus trituberculatus]|uniref:Uncharacterized protein n=1 Tax=Portunus trituberculatus TaxID=210409 RepID=A0A5B7CLH8_PORTR|nr:uncharacterized protein LOC123515722 [Portunus trituberculatus]MPC10270.1 hypothetical protein [Portunus trituberculatus]